MLESGASALVSGPPLPLPANESIGSTRSTVGESTGGHFSMGVRPAGLPRAPEAKSLTADWPDLTGVDVARVAAFGADGTRGGVNAEVSASNLGAVAWPLGGSSSVKIKLENEMERPSSLLGGVAVRGTTFARFVEPSSWLYAFFLPPGDNSVCAITEIDREPLRALPTMVFAAAAERELV